MLTKDQLTVGMRVRYRASPHAMETLPGVYVGPARAKEPAAMVHYDGEETPRIAYLQRLELEAEAEQQESSDEQ